MMHHVYDRLFKLLKERSDKDIFLAVDFFEYYLKNLFARIDDSNIEDKIIEHIMDVQSIRDYRLRKRILDFFISFNYIKPEKINLEKIIAKHILDFINYKEDEYVIGDILDILDKIYYHLPNKKDLESENLIYETIIKLLKNTNTAVKHKLRIHIFCNFQYSKNRYSPELMDEIIKYLYSYVVFERGSIKGSGRIGNYRIFKLLCDIGKFKGKRSRIVDDGKGIPFTEMIDDDTGSINAVKELCKIQTSVSTNFLILITEIGFPPVRIYSERPQNWRFLMKYENWDHPMEDHFFNAEKMIASNELISRGTPAYDPAAYLNIENW
jgi:hypothetical protein